LFDRLRFPRRLVADGWPRCVGWSGYLIFFMFTENPISSLGLLGAVAMEARSILEGFDWLSNSLFVAVIVSVLVLFVCRTAAANRSRVPTGLSNAFEALVEALYTGMEQIVGRHMVAKVFPLLGTLFIFILFANWFALLPGVGTMGFLPVRDEWGIKDFEVPLFRPATADLNMTLAMATVFFALWLVWTLRELGVFGFIHHTFGPKGGVKGGMALGLLPIFLFVGLIEVVSILFRPISLSLRLYGNVFAGENLLHAMLFLGDKLPWPLNYVGSVLFPLPFYFLELLIGLLQALVFTLLCAVYIQLATSHDEEEGQSHHGRHGHGHHGHATGDAAH